MGTLSTPALYLLLAMGSSPVEGIPRDEVAYIELNHFRDESGNVMFDQLLYYEWCSRSERYQLKAWRLLRNSNQLPVYDFATQTYVARWYDGGVLREVRSPTFRETWSTKDPEIIERQYLPKERRSELARIKFDPKRPWATAAFQTLDTLQR